MTGAIAPAGAGAEETNGSRYKGNGTEKRNMRRYLRPVSRPTWPDTRDRGMPGECGRDALPSEFSEGLEHGRRGYVLAMRV